MDLDTHHHHHDKKTECPFKQLLCVKFEAIFDVDVDIDDDSIVVECIGEHDFDLVKEEM
jgi:hypothetical protein